MTALTAKIDELVHLSEEEKQFLDSVIIPRQFKQGETIVSSGEMARYMMFVCAGYLMTNYADKEGNEHVVQFARDGWWCSDFYSFSDTPVTRFTTKALSDGEMLLLPRIAHQQLLEKYPRIERYFRIFFQNSSMRQQWRLIENYSSDAEERYQSFIITFPGMEQYVPQKYIASYLGITPEFLSRLRKRLQR
jgi:CRP-like cAMP-binding protein